jgi:hypothetical protein
LLDTYNDEFVLALCQTFNCTKNRDLENFIKDKNKAISFEKRSITKTYLYISPNKEIVAYFTISLNVLETSELSKSTIKKIDGINKNRTEIACFLIAQLGKSDTCTYFIGTSILMDAIETITEASNIIGGRVVVLDAINHTKVIKFYEENYFVSLETVSNADNIKMYYPLYLDR